MHTLRQFSRNILLSAALFSLVSSWTILNASENAGAVKNRQQWKLDSALAYVLQHNPDIKISQQKIEQAQQSIRIARASNLPTFSLGAEYSQTNNPMYSFGNILNQGAFTNSIDFNNPGRTDNGRLQMSMQYSMYSGGKTQNQIEAETAQLDHNSEQYKAIQQQLVFEVIKSFHMILQAKEMVRIRESAQEAIDASYTVAKARFDAGDLLQQDLLNLELQQSRCREERLISLNQLDLAKKIFCNLLSIDPATNDIDDTSSALLPPPSNPDFHSRSEIKALDARIRSAEAEIHLAQSANRPSLDSFAQYQIDSGTVLGETGDSWLAGVKLNYQIFDGNRTDASIARAIAKSNEVKLEKEKMILALSLDLQKAENAFALAKEQLQVTDTMVRVAEESTRLTRIRFQEGVVLASNLIDMEMRLTDAKARKVSAKSEYQIAIANLRRAAGENQFTVNQQEQKGMP